MTAPLIRPRREAHERVAALAKTRGIPYVEAAHALLMGAPCIQPDCIQPASTPSPRKKAKACIQGPPPVHVPPVGISAEAFSTFMAKATELNLSPDGPSRWPEEHRPIFDLLSDEQFSQFHAAYHARKAKAKAEEDVLDL